MNDLVDKIDAVLPQTQCGLCGYKGCKPYATALAEQKAAINLCPPGGVPGLFTIAQLVKVDPAPFIVDMHKKAKPTMRAVIREDECIGCTKCIKACPVDAILGTGKSMHTVIADECTGCELCIEPCPVDCIDMVHLPEIENEMLKTKKREQYRKRYQDREKRLMNTVSVTEKNITNTSSSKVSKDFIKDALQRVKEKKLKLNANLDKHNNNY